MIISLKRLNKILVAIKKIRIVVFGDLMLDRYLWGEAERISPEAPVPVVKVEDESERLGGAANVAWNLKTLGVEPILVGLIGEDMFGERLRRLLREFKIDDEYIVTSKKRQTTTKTRVIARNQQVVRVDREDIGNPGRNENLKLVENALSAMEQADALIISDYGKGVINKTTLRNIGANFRHNKIFVSVDPKENHFSLYKNVSLITPNQKEASNSCGIEIIDDKSLIRCARKLMRITSAESILITRGAKGMTLVRSDGSVKNYGTVARQVYDVTGAGDTVIATFTAVIAAGGSYDEAAIISSHAAGIVVGKVGTATAMPQEIVESMRYEIETKKH